MARPCPWIPWGCEQVEPHPLNKFSTSLVLGDPRPTSVHPWKVECVHMYPHYIGCWLMLYVYSRVVSPSLAQHTNKYTKAHLQTLEPMLTKPLDSKTHNMTMLAKTRDDFALRRCLIFLKRVGPTTYTQRSRLPAISVCGSHHAHTHTPTHPHPHIHVYIYIHTHIHIYISQCIYIYVYIYTY
jgi:hypothetical protein